MNDSDGGLSRRDFLKLSGLGLLGLLARARPLSFFSDASTSPRADLEPGAASEPPIRGRVTANATWAYNAPSPKSQPVKFYWRDLLVDIDNTAIDEDVKAYNRVWYKLTGGSYLYSGWVQPVHTQLNEAVPIPTAGTLGEISVPYTDAHASPDPSSRFAYRLYYESTHWVLESAAAPDGSVWYRLLDDKYDAFYYVPAKHVRILPRAELEPISPDLSPRQKRIEVRLNAQLVLAYEAGQVVFATRAATGAILEVGTYTTPVGRFSTYHKRPTRHMAAGDLTASGFDLPGVPWVLYIKDNGISLHGTYWHNDFGHPRSHGCVNLPPSAAKWLYRWTLPSVPPEKPYKYEFANATRVDVVE